MGAVYVPTEVGGRQGHQAVASMQVDRSGEGGTGAPQLPNHDATNSKAVRPPPRQPPGARAQSAAPARMRPSTAHGKGGGGGGGRLWSAGGAPRQAGPRHARVVEGTQQQRPGVDAAAVEGAAAAYIPPTSMTTTVSMPPSREGGAGARVNVVSPPGRELQQRPSTVDGHTTRRPLTARRPQTAVVNTAGGLVRAPPKHRVGSAGQYALRRGEARSGGGGDGGGAGSGGRSGGGGRAGSGLSGLTPRAGGHMTDDLRMLWEDQPTPPISPRKTSATPTFQATSNVMYTSTPTTLSRPGTARAIVAGTERAMNADVGLSEHDLQHHGVDAEMLTGLGRLINVYSHGFHQSVAHVVSGARDRQLLMSKVAQAFLRKWSDSMGVVFASPLVDMYEDNDAMRTELELKRHQADSLQEGLRKMVHLSLERMLHDRVGSQEKDLLRSQLEAERDAHRLTRERVAAHHAELATQQQYVRDYEMLAAKARRELQTAEGITRRLESEAEMMRAQLRVRDQEIAVLRTNDGRTKTALDALKSEIGFKEGQQAQLVEDAGVMVRNAELAVEDRNAELDALKKANKDLHVAKALLAGQVEALKHKFRNVKEEEELRAALQVRAEALTVELEAARTKIVACEQDAATRTAALTATVLELQQLETKWKADAQSSTERLFRADQRHAQDMAAMRESHSVEVNKLHQQLEAAIGEHERATADHSVQMEKLVAYMTNASGEAIASRDSDARRWAEEREQMNAAHAREVAELRSRAAEAADRAETTIQAMAEENAKLFKRMGRSEATAKNATEQMQLTQDESAAKVALITSLQTQTQAARDELAMTKQALALAEEQARRYDEERQTLLGTDVELKARVEFLQLAVEELPVVQQSHKEAAVRVAELEKQCASLRVELEHKKQAELRLQSEFDKREGRMQGRMTKDAAVIEEQSSMLLQRLEEVGSLTRALDELQKRFQAEVDAKASLNQDQREEIAQLTARVSRAEHSVEDYKAQMRSAKEEHLLLETQQKQTMLRLREELEAAHDTVAVKTRERMGLLDEIQAIRKMLGHLTDANDEQRIIRLQQQATYGESVHGLREEASAQRTDTIAIHPKLAASGSKSLLCVSFQRAVATTAGLSHLCSVVTSATPEVDVHEELARVLMDSCHLRTLGAVGNVVTEMEAQLKAKLAVIMEGIERQLTVQLTMAQGPLLARMHAATQRLQRYSAVLVERLAYYRKTTVVLRFKHATCSGQLNYATAELHKLRRSLVGEQESSQELTRRLSETEEKLTMTERMNLQERETLLRKLKGAEQNIVDLEVEVQAKEHKLTLLSAKADANERKATQKIASLKDVIANQIHVLDYRMRSIVDLKKQTGTFVHEALSVFQARLQSDTITMLDKAAHAEQRMGILRDNADVAQAERRSVQKALVAMTETQKITARALELQRVVASQRVLQYTWLHSLRDKAGAIQEPDRWIKYTQGTVCRLIAQVYSEKIFDDLARRERGLSVQHLRDFVYSVFLRKFKTPRFAEMALYSFLEALKQHSSVSPRARLFSQLLGHDDALYLGEDAAGFALLVMSIILDKSKDPNAHKRKQAAAADQDDDSVPPVTAFTPDVMNGGNKLLRPVALALTEQVLRRCDTAVRVACLEQLMDLEETHDGFLNLDAFMVHMMAVYAEEQRKANDVARVMFLEADRQRAGMLTLEDFTSYMCETHSKLTSEAALELYVAAGGKMHVEAFSQVVWRCDSSRFPLFELPPVRYHRNVGSRVTSEPDQLAGFHEYNEMPWLEESWEVVRDVFSSTLIEGRGMEDDDRDTFQKMVAHMDDTLIKVRLAEDGTRASTAWALLRDLTLMADVTLMKLEMASHEADRERKLALYKLQVWKQPEAQEGGDEGPVHAVDPARRID